MEPLTQEEILRHLRAALAEDIGSGDATTLATVPPDSISHAVMVAREPLVICGLDFAENAFRVFDGEIAVERLASDRDTCVEGQPVLRIAGNSRAILTAERVALNYVQRLSGIASLTAQFAALIAGTKARLLDTRKTTPGWRRLEKYAVACGGGSNHREGLFDLILIKDNHLAALRQARPNAIAAAVAAARAAYPALKVEVEADHLEQVQQAGEAGADIILLDNMTNDQLREAVALVAGRSVTEASGGVNLNTIRGIAETGVDFISVGALTHSARCVDLALDFED